MIKDEQPEWWAEARKELVMHLVQKHMASEKKDFSVLDVGCGEGNVLETLVEKFSPKSADGIELNEDLVKTARSKRLNVTRGDAAVFSLRKKYDLILLLDVLEHVDNDAAVLQNCLDHLGKGGMAIISVPMYMMLWSDHDRLIGHRRRYTQALLDELLLPVAKPLFQSYWNFFLFLPVFLARKTLSSFIVGKDRLDAEKKAYGSVENLLFGILRMENAMIRNGVMFPFGISFVAIVQKK